MTHHWHTAIYSRQTVCIIFLDYAKAFDLVDHNILVSKFQRLGTPPILLRWICGFLSDRKQRVKIGKDTSEWLTIL